MNASADVQPPYLLAAGAAELDRLRLQARVWEPAGRALLDTLPGGTGRRALDVGCGAQGWLRVLAQWVGPTGQVVGSDVDAGLLAAARALVRNEGLGPVALVVDDLFDSRLPEASFDLVHARFQIAPLGRGPLQVQCHLKLLRPGGHLVLEEPDLASWRVHPHAVAVPRLIGLIERAFAEAGGDFNAGRRLPAWLAEAGLEPRVDAHVVALDAKHPYLLLPLQFARSLRPRLEALCPPERLDALVADAARELADPRAWGTSFTLIQAWARRPGSAPGGP